MQRFKIILVAVMVGMCAPLSAMDLTTGFTEIVEEHRGYSDHIPMDIAYVPSLFSLRHQMAKYGIEKPGALDGTGYEFAQVSDAVFKDVTSMLDELNFDYTSTYILKLNPQMRDNATTVIVTNSCIFIDEDEWKRFDTAEMRAQFKKLAHKQNWNVKDPVHIIKQYILKRALAHYNKGTYRTKVASKLFVGVVLGYIMCKTMPHVNEYISDKNENIGFTDALCNSAPTMTSICSKLYIPGLLKFVGSGVLSGIISNQLRGLAHAVVTKPLWGYLDRGAEHDAVQAEAQENKKLLVFYNGLQADNKKNNAILQQEYNWRAQYISALTNKQ